MIDALCRRVSASAGVRVLPVKPLASRGSLVWRVRFGSEEAVLTQRASSLRVELPSLHRELAIYRRVATAHLAPTLLWADVSLNTFVARYVRPASSPAARSYNAIGQQLARLHQIPVRQFPVSASLDEIARHYVAMIAERHSDDVPTSLQEWVAVIVNDAHQAPPRKAVMCHRDLVATNVLDADTPVFIDWEYAGPGNRWFDVAALLEGNDVTSAQIAQFIDSYCQTSGCDMSREDVHANVAQQRIVYRALVQLWQVALPAVSELA